MAGVPGPAASSSTIVKQMKLHMLSQLARPPLQEIPLQLPRPLPPYPTGLLRPHAWHPAVPAAHTRVSTLHGSLMPAKHLLNTHVRTI